MASVSFHTLCGLVVVMTVYTVLASTAAAAAATPACNDPAREHLEQLWQDQSREHESIFQLAPMAGVVTSLEDVPEEYVHVRRLEVTEPRCRLKVKNTSQNRSSLCETYDVVTYDENRIPSTLFEKGCSCLGGSCGVRVHGELHKVRSVSDSYLLSCQPFFYNTTVLRRVGCANNVFIYKRVLEPLAVGCVCATVPRIRA